VNESIKSIQLIIEAKAKIDLDNEKLWLAIKNANGDFSKFPHELPSDAVIYASPDVFEKIQKGTLKLSFVNHNIDVYKINHLLGENQLIIKKV